MNAHERIETKELIMKTAERLFAELGYGGTSIRNIASESGTNVAAVNYHFNSKENLYWQVMNHSHNILEQGIAQAAESAKTAEALAGLSFDFILEHSKQFKNAMKMLLSEEVNVPSSPEARHCLERPGPPGYQYFIPLIRAEVGEGVSPVVVDWAVKAIFASIMWWSMLFESQKFRSLRESDPAFTPEFFRSHITAHAGSILTYIREHHKELQKKLPPLPKIFQSVVG